MDELLRDFLTESNEHLAEAESLLVKFERTPTDSSLIASIFRLVHTIKGTSGFIGLDRLQSVAHVAETLLGRMRDGEPPTQEGVSLVLASIDHIRDLLHDIEMAEAEPPGDSSGIISAIEAYLASGSPNRAGVTALTPAPGAAAVIPQEPEHSGPVPEDEGAQPDDEKHATDLQSNDWKPAGSPLKPAKNADESKSKPGSASSGETIRVTVSTIESIMQLVSELVLARNQLIELTRASASDGLKIALQRLSGLTSDLQDAVMRARMQPVSRLFGNLPRLVRELSLGLDKKIEIVTEGGDTELDRQLIEVIRDPLTHIIRNCADHGIEPPEERLAAGKPAHGEIRARAYQEAGQFVIEINDDGRGIDVERVRAKAIAKNLMREHDAGQMSEEEICRFIFEPGFSTAPAVSNVSGRGVGMDVVRSNIESVRGSVSLATTKGHGTRLTMRIPLTLAIAPALIVEVAGQRFALPQHSVAEVVEARRGDGGTVKSVQDRLMVDLRGEVIPAAELPSLLGIGRADDESAEAGLIVVMRASTSSLGLLVDAVVDVQEIVVKPLSGCISHLDVYSGQTILGDGSVLLILDPSGIARRLGIGSGARMNSQRAMDDMRQDATRLVMFRAGEGIIKALPTSIIARIEQVKSLDLKRSETGVVMNYQGRLIPVIELGTAGSAEVSPVIVVSFEDTLFGLLIDQIVDIVEDAVEIDVRGDMGRTIGTCRVNGEVVDLLDPIEFVAQVRGTGARHRADGSKNVLLLTGDARSIDLIAPLVKAAGYRVTTAQSAGAARALAASRSKVDVILFDLDSPVSNMGELSSIDNLVGTAPVIALKRESKVAATAGAPGLNPSFTADLYDRRQLIEAIQNVLVSAN